ncbi:Bis(5'-nucleosyl)-tetraphosphatase [asymmetrical]-like protein [Plakobranchus ocellatus]|uniref:Bis(5'-nucleosyl)-tetraphosphatase [asymmetrical] n=1 Tax=Plakobranchus ocellatus TaxID=259542 RepID=A0AAV4CMP7_9GAST|nr:Bis(5'-nucleosyl)-tetraphosphatase [asymmetrical]-like protein [Plakobranchus ocellatus]
MTSQNLPTVAAGFIIYRKVENQPEYLFLQTSYGRHHWTPPKGHVDPGESEFETALRETEEEAGIKREQMKVEEDFQRTLHYTVQGKPKRVVYWLSELSNPDDPIKLSDEHKDFQWQKLDKACELAQFSDMVSLLKEVDTYLESKS